MPSVPANTSASIAASGQARLRLRISGVAQVEVRRLTHDEIRDRFADFKKLTHFEVDGAFGAAAGPRSARER